jgi:hypothetical protein
MPTPELTPEDIALIDKIKAENHRMKPDKDGGVVGRAQHRKQHGCVAAVFQVADDDVPEELRKGVFTNSGERGRFDALIRFSSGRQQDDSKADAHGMAIKLLDVPASLGKRPDGQDWQTVQDFVLVDDELFFTGDLDTYEAVNRIIAEGVDSPLAKTLLKFIPSLMTVVQLELLDHGELLKQLRAFANQRPASPLATDYWSTTPYALGSAIVKYKAACPATNQQPVAGKDKDYLNAALAAGLRAGPASFDFVVHVQTDPEHQPIDDPTVSWSKNGAREFKLATITIPKQPVLNSSRLAETIVYSPWNCLEAHVPLGKINLARKHVYPSLAVTRHGQKESERQEWTNVPHHERPVVKAG